MGKLKKIKSVKFLALLASGFMVSACAAGHCRGRNPAADDVKIFVYKPDGSKQCDKKTGISVDKMAEELGEIKIFSKENKSDGNMHIMMCGTPTGKINVYEINKADFDKIKGFGFKELVK